MFCLLTVSSLLLRLLFCPCFLLSCLCLFTFTVDGNHRLRRTQPGTRLFFVLSFPFSSPRWNAGGRGMLGVSKRASVLGVSGEQPRHNSRVEWAGERREGKMNSMLWGFPNPSSLQGLCRLHCAEFYPYLTKHPARDEGQELKWCFTAFSHSGFVENAAVRLVTPSFFAGEKLFESAVCVTVLFQSLIQLCPIFHNSSYPCFLFSQSVPRACMHIHHHDGAPMVCTSLPMLVCTNNCARACVCGFLVQRSRPRYGCKSQRKADKLEPQWQFDFLPSERTLLPNLGKELPRAPGEERPPSLLPPSLPPIPFISLIMSLCQRQGGVIQKEKRRARTGGNLRQARGIIHWLTQRDAQTPTDSYTGKPHCLMAGRHTQTCTQTAQERGRTLGKHTLCKQGKRPFSFVTDMQTYREAEITDTSPVFALLMELHCPRRLSHLLPSLGQHNEDTNRLHLITP